MLGRLPRNFLAAARAVWQADRGVEEPQVVVNFGNRADRRARVAVGGLLFDGDGRAEPFDGVHLGPLHLLAKLPGIRGEGLDVAPLALGVKDVEGEARLARPAQSRDYSQPVARDVEVDVFQVVLAGASD